MLEYCAPWLREAERVAQHGNSAEILAVLRNLCLDDFAELMLGLPASTLPYLSAQLPKMASEEVQQSWTGATGRIVMGQACNFVRIMNDGLWRTTGSSLSGKRILDFGCGWGRILRLMLFYSDPKDIFGVDPWDRSLEICREDGMLGQLALSDYLPKSLPFEGEFFDAIYAFSVFTHLSERAAKTAMSALRSCIKPDGLLVITIRPVEYWGFASSWDPQVEPRGLEASHTATGFAFRPHLRSATDGDITYGDTSMTFAWMTANFEGWRIVGYDRSMEDQMQVVVHLQPA